jgi:ribulose 1,5-bisphosphate synthetase/thiazole synthase
LVEAPSSFQIFPSKRHHLKDSGNLLTYLSAIKLIMEADIRIIGSGPAGASTAIAMRKKERVLTLDSKTQVGKPIHCAGGTDSG